MFERLIMGTHLKNCYVGDVPPGDNHPGVYLKTAVLSLAFISIALIAGGAARTGTANAPADVNRGKYIVESVAMCGQCHTPRDAGGELLRSQWLRGASIPVQNPFPIKQWGEFAPRIAGLPQYSDEQALTLFTKGISRTGMQLRRPMPPFRMSDEDARDVIAYLRSLE